MTKIFCAAIAALLLAMPVAAQNGDSTKTEKKPKKEGGFWKAVKKGVESTTGIDVSKETLFVYPTIGEHKLTLVSCKGDKATGTVKFVFGVSYLGSGKYQAQPVMTEVYYNKAKQNVIKQHYHHLHHDITATPIPVELMDSLIGVPVEVTNIERLVFRLNYGEQIFEARDVPITWE